MFTGRTIWILTHGHLDSPGKRVAALGKKICREPATGAARAGGDQSVPQEGRPHLHHGQRLRESNEPRAHNRFRWKVGKGQSQPEIAAHIRLLLKHGSG